MALPYPKQHAHAPLPEDEQWEAHLPSDPTRPVYTAIRAAFVERFTKYYILATETVFKVREKKFDAHPEELSMVASEIVRLEDEYTKLAVLLFPAGESSLAIRARQWDAQMGKGDWFDPAIVKLLRRNLRRWRPGRGRPAKLQPVGLRALELRLIDRKRWSWNALPNELCRCGAEKHGFKCRENIRREVYLLKETLESLRVKLPPVS